MSESKPDIIEIVAAVEQSLADADQFHCPTALIATDVMREILGRLQGGLSSARRTVDPFFADADRVALLRELGEIQAETCPERERPRQSPGRLGAIGQVLAEGYTADDIKATWRWWLRHWPDKFKGRWLDTFFVNYVSYHEEARSAKASADAGKFTVPKLGEQTA